MSSLSVNQNTSRCSFLADLDVDLDNSDDYSGLRFIAQRVMID